MRNDSLLPNTTDAELTQQVESDFNSALKHLILGQTPKDVIKQKPGRGGRQQDFVPGWWFCHEANSLFGHLWSIEVKELKTDTENDQVVALVRVSITAPGKTVVETRPDGTRIETRYDSVTVCKEQFGGSDIKRRVSSAGKGKVIDLADDHKAAATDGMKKCFSLFGFARDVYGPRELEEEAGPKQDDTYLKILAKTAKLGWDEATTVKWLEESTGSPFTSLGPADFARWLGKVPKQQ